MVSHNKQRHESNQIITLLEFIDLHEKKRDQNGIFLVSFQSLNLKINFLVSLLKTKFKLLVLPWIMFMDLI